jgi:peptidoglycan/xylan/chitin deacetylase (PgdA/CDA1 family)
MQSQQSVPTRSEPSRFLRGPAAASASRTAKRVLTQTRVLTWTLRRQELENGLRILIYHRVTDDSDPLALSPAKFRAQMDYLVANGFRGLDAVTALDLLYAGQLEPRTVAITFDDGFEDVLDNAHPVLSKLGFSATVFVATSVIGGDASYSWAPPGASTLSWEQIRRLDTAGVLRFEPHSLTHPDLTRLLDADARREIEESKAELERQIDRETHAFCYPSGFLQSREGGLVREAGFRYGITCEPGLNTASTDPCFIRRVHVDGPDSLRVFRAKLAGSHDTPLPGRRLYRRVRYGVPSESLLPDS